MQPHPARLLSRSVRSQLRAARRRHRDQDPGLVCVERLHVHRASNFLWRLVVNELRRGGESEHPLAGGAHRQGPPHARAVHASVGAGLPSGSRRGPDGRSGGVLAASPRPDRAGRVRQGRGCLPQVHLDQQGARAVCPEESRDLLPRPRPPALRGPDLSAWTRGAQ